MEIDKNILYELYINQNKNMKEIGISLNCSERTIRRYLKFYGISKKPDISKEELYNLFVISGLSQKEIASTFNTTTQRIKSLLSYYKITRPQIVIDYNELREYYIDSNHTIQETANYFNVSYVTITRFIKKYQLFKDSEHRSDRIKKTCQERYGVNSTTQLTDVKKKQEDTLLKHYGVRIPAKKPEIQIRGQNTRKKNGTCNTSKPEEILYKKLKNKYPDVRRQYNTLVEENSNRYPFNCDFYIPSLNVFIEYQGNWTHGKEPFDSKNPEHIERLEFLKSKAKTSKYYKSCLEVWTIKDPLKRKIAQRNNLKFKEIWSF